MMPVDRNHIVEDKSRAFDRQCILRLPEDIAEKLHHHLEDSIAANDDVAADVDLSILSHPQAETKVDSSRHYVVEVFGEKLHGVLVNCPCHAQTHKTHDDIHMFTSGDVSQMLVAYRVQDGPPLELQELLDKEADIPWLEWPHGICNVASVKDIGRKRFLRDDIWSYEDYADGDNIISCCLAEQEVILLDKDVVTMGDYRSHEREKRENPNADPIWKAREDMAADPVFEGHFVSASGVGFPDDDGSVVSGPGGALSAAPSGTGGQRHSKSHRPFENPFKSMVDDSDDDSVSFANSSAVGANDDDVTSISGPATNIWQWRSYA